MIAAASSDRGSFLSEPSDRVRVQVTEAGWKLIGSEPEFDAPAREIVRELAALGLPGTVRVDVEGDPNEVAETLVVALWTDRDWREVAPLDVALGDRLEPRLGPIADRIVYGVHGR